MKFNKYELVRSNNVIPESILLFRKMQLMSIEPILNQA